MLNLKHIALIYKYPTGLICYYVKSSEIITINHQNSMFAG